MDYNDGAICLVSYPASFLGFHLCTPFNTERLGIGSGREAITLLNYCHMTEFSCHTDVCVWDICHRIVPVGYIICMYMYMYLMKYM